MLWLFGIFKIPMIAYCKPRIVELTDSRVVIRIRLRRRTKNHLGSMYFGAMAVGADLAGGFLAFVKGREGKDRVSLVFKDFHCEFIKRPYGDVYFMAENGSEVEQMIAESRNTGERITRTAHISAVTGYPSTIEKVAEFQLGLSIKVK